MACNEWNDDWVAHLYGELDGAERERLDAHLPGCTDCRATLEELAGSRRVLQDVAPYVPVPPRLVVVQPRRFRQAGWAFAAGLACAMLVFAAGLFAAPLFLEAASDGRAEPIARSAATEPTVLTRADLEQALAAQQERFETRLAGFAAESPNGLTQQQLDDELLRVRNELRRDQARDFRLLLGEINQNTVRTAGWIDENRNVLRYALRQGAAVGEH